MKTTFQFSMKNLQSFNPFIQVFYFYQITKELRDEVNEKFVLIPLFRSFIFTMTYKIKHTLEVHYGFNPFIQVFYFYKHKEVK